MRESEVSEQISGLDYLNRLPWERIVTWGLFLLALYVLRDFFFVVFATFLICYFVRRICGVILRATPKAGHTIGVQRFTTVSVFAVLIVFFVGLMFAICPELYRQARTVLVRVEKTNIQSESESLLFRTVGSFLFQQKFGDGSAGYEQKLLDEHKTGEDFGNGWWEAWPVIQTSVAAQHVLSRPVPVVEKHVPGAAEESNAIQNAFEQYCARNPDIDIDFATFSQWNEAFGKGQPEFIEAFKKTLASADAEQAKQLVDNDFEYFNRSKLTRDWLETDPVAGSIRHYLDEHRPEYVSEIGVWTQRIVRTAFAIPFQLGLALLISFLICLDAPNILNRVRSVRDTRVRHYYDEIAPMMSNFGKLTGKAIESHIVIGAINTVLTVAVLLILGVENIYFLASVILVSSIVPVIGAIFAAVVVAMMAAIQPDGSLTLAIEALVAMLIIHAVTSVVVAPRIYGKSFHLHPVLVLVILILAEHFFGMWGLVLGVPVAVYLINITLRGNSVLDAEVSIESRADISS